MRSQIKCILFTAAVFIGTVCLLTASCLELKKNAPVPETAVEMPDKARLIRQEYISSIGYINKVEFDGHTYIVFSRSGVGITHDPDCACHNKAHGNELQHVTE